ncbi:MAG: phage terminase large subunit [Clostridia bacterium]|nr:phage terminase large subunit [Clostridia bacterium]
MSNAIWTPQPRQTAFMARPEDEALYGGAAGGGKSDALVIEATRQVHIPHYKALLLRKTYPQLSELIEKSLLYYPRIFPKARYNASDHTWRFPSGAKIVFGSLQHSKDKYNYQGKAFDFIAFDELTHFTYDEYIYLVSRNRPNGPGTRCYIRATANPGGIGHGWVKDRFITAAPPMTTIWEKVTVEHPDGRKTTDYKSRIFVPSSVFDNKALLANDPQYLVRLASMPEAERKALLYGDWDSYSGQYFAEWKNDPTHYDDRRWTHVINPFDIPDGWQIYRSFDWGYNKPFSCGWWAIDYDGVAYRIAEFYGSNGEPNVGLRWHARKVFAEIHKVECEHPWLKGKDIIGVADPAIWSADGGESVADAAATQGVYFSKGDNQRIAGWLQMHYRLAFDDNGFPMMYVFNTCKDFIRTVPALIYDEHKVEDLNTEGEDHVADESRYFCMARPITPRTAVLPDAYASNPMKVYLDIPKENIKKSARRPRMEVIDG